MTTKSPVSTCGAKVGLCLPRSRIAVWLASRPSTTSVASITCQCRVTSPGFGLYVRTDLPRHQECGARCAACTSAGLRPAHGWAHHRTTRHEDTRCPFTGSKRVRPRRSGAEDRRRHRAVVLEQVVVGDDIGRQPLLTVVVVVADPADRRVHHAAPAARAGGAGRAPRRRGLGRRLATERTDTAPEAARTRHAGERAAEATTA